MAKAVAAPLPESVEIARFMGLPHPDSFSDLNMIKAIRDGLPAHSADAVARHLDPTGAFVSVYDFVPKSTLHRRRQDNRRLSKDASEQLWQVARVFVEAHRHYGGGREALEFLMRRHPLLDGQTPFALAKETVAGADLVLRLLAEAEAGVAL
jgi:putative toxin-antitoxin system antitoxin component (TIGR02293 family)